MSSKNIGTEHQAIAVDEFITELAYKLDRFAEELDSYDYQDKVVYMDDHINEIKRQIGAGEIAPFREFLNETIAETESEHIASEALQLRKLLDKLDTPKKESVMDKMMQNADKIAPAKSSHKPKEAER